MDRYYKDLDGNLLENPIVSNHVGLVEITKSERDLLIVEIEQNRFNSLSYKEKRAIEYPNIADYLDAKVKQSSTDVTVQAEGVAQEQTYLDSCLAVKAKYPKV